MPHSSLSVDDIKKIHEILVDDFASAGDPISPAGLRSDDLLESAVSRQHTSFGETLKYPTPIAGAATLAYGICCNHCFHNGNKRAALVAMLVHLDRNRLTLFNTTEEDLYLLMLAIADHSVGLPPNSKLLAKLRENRSADSEVQAIINWLESRTAKVTKGDREITYSELKRVLSRYDIRLENPKKNTIDVMRYQQKRKLFGGVKTVSSRLGNIPYPGGKRDVGISVIKYVRQICELTDEHGIDSDAFYFDTAQIDNFVNKYRGVLRKLGKT